MKRRRVVVSPSATRDLIQIYDWIADRAGASTAFEYVGRIRRYCAGFDLAAERGQSLNNVYPGLRAVGFERRATIVLRVEAERVTVVGVYRAGLNWKDRLKDDLSG